MLVSDLNHCAARWHGQFAGSFAMFSEITAIKRTEEQLAARESLLQQIFDTSSVAIFLVDKQGHHHPYQPAHGRDVPLPAGAVDQHSLCRMCIPKERAQPAAHAGAARQRYRQRRSGQRFWREDGGNSGAI